MLNRKRPFGQVYGSGTKVKFFQEGCFFDGLDNQVTETGYAIGTVEDAERTIEYATGDMKRAQSRFNSARNTDPDKNPQREAEMETALADENCARSEIEAAEAAIIETTVRNEMEAKRAARSDETDDLRKREEDTRLEREDADLKREADASKLLAEETQKENDELRRQLAAATAPPAALTEEVTSPVDEVIPPVDEVIPPVDEVIPPVDEVIPPVDEVTLDDTPKTAGDTAPLATPPAAPVDAEVAKEALKAELEGLAWQRVKEQVVALGGKWENKVKGVAFILSQQS